MPQVDPRRWLVLLIMGPLLVGAFGVFFGRFLGDELGLQQSLLTGVAVGLAATSIFALMYFRHVGKYDARRFAVAHQRPHALVLQARNEKEFLQALRALEPRANVKGYLATVAIEPEGVSVWSGFGLPERVLLIAPADVISISVGSPFAPTSYGEVPYARLAVEVRAQAGLVQLMFGVEHVPGFGSNRFTKNDAEVAELAQLARDVLGRRATAPATSRLVMSQVPGRSAWLLARFARFIMFGYAVLLVPTLINVWSTVTTNKTSPAFGLLVLCLLCLSATQFLLRRSAARAMLAERAAGYTTLNGVELDLPQLNPHTGRVIRQPGELALSADEFRRELNSAR